jgi:hypothetical protein
MRDASAVSNGCCARLLSVDKSFGHRPFSGAPHTGAAAGSSTFALAISKARDTLRLMIVRGRSALLLVPTVAGALVGAVPAKLAPDQMAKAARTDTITIPTPGELFAALQKPSKPNWTGAYRGPIPTT